MIRLDIIGENCYIYIMMIFCDEEKEKKPQEESFSQVLQEKFLKTRQIILSGEINKELADKIVRQLLVLEADSDKPITVFIDSPGGDVDSGFAIFDMIKFVKPVVYLVGMGLVASAAALVLLASPIEKRLALPDSHYLIHQPMSGIKGVATEIQIHAAEIAKTHAKLNELIAKETGKPLSQVEKDTDRDYWLNALEAKDYGLVSGVVNSREELERLISR